jgi:hypothetical protein
LHCRSTIPSCREGVTFIVAAHNEEAVIERRLANLLALDYPPHKIENRRRIRPTEPRSS